MASMGLVRAGFGMDWSRTLPGAWLVLRANQLWAPYPGHDAQRPRVPSARLRGHWKRAQQLGRYQPCRFGPGVPGSR
jgi:hypothetical protein